MSNIISLLPENVANQIAAGEVVQRPASVVKELLENAIDAGAKKIRLIVKDCGKTLIQVIDNGTGMNPFDARMCFERHSTSKIKNTDDLFNLSTKGFRGEALASIAAVSQVELKTKKEFETVGQLIEVEGGKFARQSECQCIVGSVFTVKNLFFNIPARRNFLKEDSTELKHIIDEFERVALPHADIHFEMWSNNNELFNLPATSLIQRIIGLFGNSLSNKLVSLEQTTSVVKISGYLGKPETAKKKRGDQYFFVNNRFIRSAYLNHSVYESYRELISGDSHPAWYIFLEVNPKDIDINIHPTKTEIKFIDEKIIYSLLQSSVKRALGKANLGPGFDFDSEINFMPGISGDKLTHAPKININPSYNPFKQQPAFNRGEISSLEKINKEHWETLYDGFKNKDEGKLTDQPIPNEIAENKQLLLEALSFKSFQISGKYIVTSFGENIVAIDQQRAHERVLYEYFLRAKEDSGVITQQLLFPTHIELSANDFVLAQSLIKEFKLIGFDIESFGKNNIIVNGTPSDLGEFNISQMIEGVLESYKLNTFDRKIEMRDNLCRSIAKNTCIKYGKTMDEKEIQSLIHHLFNCESPMFSPQGKPVIMEISKDQLNQFFKQ